MRYGQLDKLAIFYANRAKFARNGSIRCEVRVRLHKWMVRVDAAIDIDRSGLLVGLWLKAIGSSSIRPYCDQDEVDIFKS